MTKQLFEHAHAASLEEQLALEAELQQAAVGTADFAEGVAPSWRSGRRASPAPRTARPASEERRCPSSFPSALDDARAAPDPPRRHRRPRAEPRDGLLPPLPRDPALHLARALGHRRAWFAVIAAWFVGIFTGRVPDGLHGFIASYVRYLTHVYAYFARRRPLPRRSGRRSGYPVDVEIAPAAKQSRLTIFFRLLLAIPALHRPLRPQLRRGDRGVPRAGSTPCSPASCTRACATCSPTGSATRRRRIGYVCSADAAVPELLRRLRARCGDA